MLCLRLACASLLAASAARGAVVLGTEFSGSPFGGFVDISQRLRRWVRAANTSQNAALDANGWPTEDAMTVVFDNRCFPGWNPPCDDPWSLQAPINGTYKLNFTGKADLSPGNDPGEKGVTITDVTFDTATWTTAASINLAAGSPDLLELTFTNTQRASGAATGSGFTGLRVMQPGGDASFTGPRAVDPLLLRALGVGLNLSAPIFHHVRYMGETGTNTNPGYYGDTGHHYLGWDNRCLPSDAIVPLGDSVRKGCWGMPWEDVIRITQESGLGAWVNLPVSATVSLPVNQTDYAYNMASLFKNGNAFTGNAGVGVAPIYLEHSNEVWNFGFGQYIWNKLAAIDECNTTVYPAGCLWNNDGSKDQEVWAQRRHIFKVHQLTQNFAAVFGPGSINTQIRGVYADWPLFPDRYNSTLSWFNATVGFPGDFLYGMAITGYFGGDAKTLGPTPTLDDIYTSYRNDSDKQFATRTQFAGLAKSWGLKLLAYEAGPGWSVGETTGVAQWILAQRFAEMRQVIKYDLETSWEPSGADAYNAFSLSGDYSRYGMWGFAEWLQNISTPRYCALVDMTQPADQPLPKELAGCKGW